MWQQISFAGIFLACYDFRRIWLTASSQFASDLVLLVTSNVLMKHAMQISSFLPSIFKWYETDMLRSFIPSPLLERFLNIVGLISIKLLESRDFLSWLNVHSSLWIHSRHFLRQSTKSFTAFAVTLLPEAVTYIWPEFRNIFRSTLEFSCWIFESWATTVFWTVNIIAHWY
jgi:hypothetical protein